MRELTDTESEVAQLIADSLNLDLGEARIDPHAPLFGDGLGLDSIDALELSVEISRRYGFQLRSDDPDNTRIFSSLAALASHIQTHRTR